MIRSSRKIELTESSGSDGLALLIAEIVLGGAAPDHLSIEEALQSLDQLDPEIGRRVRRAGQIMHAILVQTVDAAVRNARGDDETKH